MKVTDWITAISAGITAIATAAIALLTIRLKNLETERSRKEKEFQQQLRDLYQAIVVATIVSDPYRAGNYVSTIAAFNALYKGKTQIFERQG